MTDGKKDLKLDLLAKATNTYKCVRVYFKYTVPPGIITLFVTFDGHLNILGCQVALLAHFLKPNSGTGSM